MNTMLDTRYSKTIIKFVALNDKFIGIYPDFEQLANSVKLIKDTLHFNV